MFFELHGAQSVLLWLNAPVSRTMGERRDGLRVYGARVFLVTRAIMVRVPVEHRTWHHGEREGG